LQISEQLRILLGVVGPGHGRVDLLEEKIIAHHLLEQGEHQAELKLHIEAVDLINIEVIGETEDRQATLLLDPKGHPHGRRGHFMVLDRELQGLAQVGA
jgi:hypothetical protein